MKKTLKLLAVLLGVVLAGWLAMELLTRFMWMCYYAGIPM